MTAIPVSAHDFATRTDSAAQRVLTQPAVAFVTSLVRTFGPRLEQLLAARRARQARFDAGERPDFLASTAHIREADWAIDPIPSDVLDRRIEITGPVDRKMMINGLGSGANVFMADFEDATSPTFENVLAGQVNVADAVRGTITYDDPVSGKHYALPEKHLAVLMVRPRGLHLVEKCMIVGGRPVPASLFDFGLFFFHDAEELVARGKRPYLYLPKLESHLEARLWNDVFLFAEKAKGLPRGTTRATVLIETLPAAFEMDEILYELREHVLGLNCGRWDYIFSFIKTLANDPKAVLPDRSQVGMDQPFLRAYAQLLIRTCHRRGAFAMGGMAAQIPIKHDDTANAKALAKVRADKQREAVDGHDGTWVAHPGLIPIARSVFDGQLDGPNQLHVKRDDVAVRADELLKVPQGTRTEEGLRHNVRVGVQYLAAWLGGQGCVPLYDLMEDAATAEISRTQVWQWLRHGADVSGAPLTKERFAAVLSDELSALGGSFGSSTSSGARSAPSNLDRAAQLFHDLCVADELPAFLTTRAYDELTRGLRPLCTEPREPTRGA